MSPMRISFVRRVLRAAAKTPVWLSFAIGLALVLPALTTGWVADDDIHRLLLRPDPGVRGFSSQPLDLFRFADGDPNRAHQLMEEGVFPWWAEPRVQLAFFRPLSSLTHWLDARLWPDSALLMHLQSWLWYAALLGLVWLLYRRLASSEAAARFAFLAFAIDDAHAPVVGWIANRNLLIAIGLGLPAILLHAQCRRTGQWLPGVLAHGLFALALLAGEGAYVIVAYLIAYAVVLDRASLRSRVSSVCSYLAIGLGFRLLTAHFGYGVIGSGLYLDPVQRPLAFAITALTRFPALLLGTFAFPSADLWEVYPLFRESLQTWVLAFGGILLWGLGLAFYRNLRQNRVARFWLLSSGLATLPLCAVFPHDRLLLGPGIGAMGALGELFAAWLTRDLVSRSRGFCQLLLVVHLGIAPVLAPLRSADVGRLSKVLRAQDDTVSKQPEIVDRTLILLNPPVDPFAAYFPIFRQARREPRPKRFYWLATGVDPIRVTGIDQRTLSLRPARGFLASSSQQMLRNAVSPFGLHQEVLLQGCSIRIEALTADGRPQEIRVQFSTSLRDRSLSWMVWRSPGYVPFVPPAPGQSIELPRVDLWQALFG